MSENKYKNNNFLYVLFLTSIMAFTACKKELAVSSKIYKNTTIDSLAKQDSAASHIIAPYKNQLYAEMNKIIGENKEEISNKAPELKLTYLVAHIILSQANETYKAKADFALMNSGGIRVPSLPAGPIKLEEVFEIMPFENQLIGIRISGVLAFKLLKKVEGAENLVLNNVLKLHPEGRVEDFVINGKVLHLDSTYVLAVSDYLAQGGDGLDFLNDASEKLVFNTKIRDEIIRYIKIETEAGRKIKL